MALRSNTDPLRPFLLFFFFFAFCLEADAQAGDSLSGDSLWIYRKIKSIAERNKWTKKAYHLVFVDPQPREYPKNPVGRESKNVNPYLKYQKKIIRKINIDVYDPFGHCLTDTACVKLNVMQKMGNKLHVSTRDWVIRNRLLFKENDTVNALTLSETERLLRGAVFVNDAKVFITRTASRDSVDVNVIVIDKWPLVLPVVLSDVSASATLRNHNFFGQGQQFQQYAKFSRPDRMEYNGYYAISNIDNTFISSQIGYQTNLRETGVYLSLDRPFFTPLVKYAYGAYVHNQWRKFEYTDQQDSVLKKAPVDQFGYDLWVQRAFKLKTDNILFNQSANMIAGLRHYNGFYLQRPSKSIDKDSVHSNVQAGIGNLGFAVQQYYKDRYIYRFGANEDVPEGLIVQFIYGGIKPEFMKIRYYLGTEVARAKHFDFGYLNASFAYGVFFNSKVNNDVTASFRLNYFSNLVRNRRWLFRQFINYSLVHGQNKLNNESVTLTSEELYGFQSQSLYGKTKMVLNSEAVGYAPWYLLGFRFAPVIHAGFGMIGDPQNPILKSRLYQGYALGIMFRNENLLTSTFQLSLGLYPFFPDQGDFKMIYNPIASFTLRVRSFTVSRPDFVSYY